MLSQISGSAATANRAGKSSTRRGRSLRSWPSRTGWRSKDTLHSDSKRGVPDCHPSQPPPAPTRRCARFTQCVAVQAFVESCPAPIPRAGYSRNASDSICRWSFAQIFLKRDVHARDMTDTSNPQEKRSARIAIVEQHIHLRTSMTWKGCSALSAILHGTMMSPGMNTTRAGVECDCFTSS